MAASEQDSIDYAEAYKDVHTINRPMVSKSCPRVMTIYRMYLPLSALDCRALEGADGVEELLVVADVVAIGGNEALRIPGTRRVVIICRLIVATQDLAIGQAAIPSGISIHISLADGSGGSQTAVSLTKPRDADCYSYKAPQFAAGVPAQLFVYAQQLDFDQEGAGLNLSFLQRLASLTTDLWTANEITGKHATDTFKKCTLVHQGVRSFDDFMQPVRLLLSDGKSFLTHYFDEEEGGARVKQELGPCIGVSVRGSDAVPAHLLEDANVAMGLEATLLAAEGILLYGQNAAGAVTGALEHSGWLITHVLPNRGLVQDEAQREELQSLYVRAQALWTLYGSSGKPTMLVPGLNYRMYRQVIDEMAAAAKLYDDDLKATLRQIETLEVDGAYFLEQNKVLAQKEQDMESYTGRVAQLQKHELDEALAQLDKLNASMATQQQAMEQAQKDMDAAVKKYEEEQLVQAAFAVIGAIFAVASVVATGGATAGEAVSAIDKLVRLGKRVAKLVEILKKLYALLQAINHLRDQLNKMNSEQPTEMSIPDAPSDSDWDIFVDEVELVADTMPAELAGEKNTWKAKCKNVAAVARDISLTTVHVTALQYQITLLGWQQDMAAKQRQRLESLDAKDLSSYQELATQLEMKTRRTINALLAMLNVQNGALYYHYLQEPEEPRYRQPSVASVMQTLVDRDRMALDWHEFLGKSSDVEQTYVLSGAPVEVLLAGDDLNFSIAVDDTLAFPASWQRVRVRYVEVRFTGDNVPTTGTGKLYFLLRGDRVFYDRLHGQVLQYQASRPLQYAYAYRLGTGDTTFGNRDISTEEGEFMRMTPFNRWKLRASKSAEENVNLRFPDSAVTEITLTFFLTVIRAHET